MSAVSAAAEAKLAPRVVLEPGRRGIAGATLLAADMVPGAALAAGTLVGGRVMVPMDVVRAQ